MQLHQVCDLLHEEYSEFFFEKLDQPLFFRIAFRLPDWVAIQPEITVNGEVVPSILKEGYLIIERTWREDDHIVIRLKKQMQAVGLPEEEKVFAFQYGPFVLAAKLGKEYMGESVGAGVDLTAPAYKVVGTNHVQLPITYGETMNRSEERRVGKEC